MEPRKNSYLPQLKQLLDVPGSRYHLRDWDGDVPWHPEPYITEGLLPDLQRSSNKTHESVGRNDSLLIIANMSSLTKGQRPEYKSGYESHKTLVKFTSSIIARSDFHAHGPVRMLMWVTGKEKSALVPRTVSQRRKLSLCLETACHVEEIVTGSQVLREKNQSREDILNVKSGKQVAERMRRLNVQIPPERQDETQRKVQEIFQGKAGDNALKFNDLGGKSPGISREWHEELRQLKTDFKSGKLSQFTGGPAGVQSRRRRHDPRIFSPEWLRMVELERTIKSQERRKDHVDKLTIEQEKLDTLEFNAYREGLSEADRQEMLDEFDRQTREFKAQLEHVNVDRSTQLKFLMDDRRAYAQNPPLLMWDQRSAEPLLAREDEFHTPKDMALLDFQPRVPNPYPMTVAQAAFFQLIVSTLFSYGSQTPSCLKQLAPGAMEALVPRVPALQDPWKGGRRDLTDLRTRVMTPEMVYGLTLAWDKWPFKPPLLDIRARGSAVNDFTDNSLFDPKRRSML